MLVGFRLMKRKMEATIWGLGFKVLRFEVRVGNEGMEERDKVLYCCG